MLMIGANPECDTPVMVKLVVDAEAFTGPVPCTSGYI